MHYLLAILLLLPTVQAASSSLDGEVFVAAGTTGTNALPTSRTTNTTALVQGTAPDGTAILRVNSAATHSTGNMVELQNNTTNVLTFDYGGYAGTLGVRTQLNIGSSGQAHFTATGSTLTLSNSALKVVANVPGTSVPVTLENLDPSAGVATALDFNVTGTNVTRILSTAFTTLDNTTGHEWWIQSLNKSGSLALQLLAYSEGDVFIGFPAVVAPTSTNGFIHIPSASGLPTAIPYYFTSTQTPLIFNRIDNRLWAYNTNWFDVSGQVITMTSDAAIGTSILVKAGSDSTHVDVCGAGNIPMGVSLTSTSSASQSIRIMLLCGSVSTMTASGAITFGTILEPAASGAVQAIGGGVGTHYGVGRALETKTNATMKVQTLFFKLQI